jgi:predicted transcriptional regulator
MRTTLDIDDDVLRAAKELARHQDRTAGQIISELVRKGLTIGRSGALDGEFRNGVRLLPSRGEIITVDHVETIMDEEGI